MCLQLYIIHISKFKPGKVESTSSTIDPSLQWSPVPWIVKEMDRKLAGVSVETYLRFVMSLACKAVALFFGELLIKIIKNTGENVMSRVLRRC